VLKETLSFFSAQAPLRQNRLFQNPLQKLWDVTTHWQKVHPN